MHIIIPLYPYLHSQLLLDFLITFYYILRPISGCISSPVKHHIFINQTFIQPFLRRDAMHSAAIAVMRLQPSCGVCVSVRLSVRHVRRSCSHTILVIPYQTGWQHSDGKPPNGASNAVGYRHKARSWSNSWLSKIGGREKCQKIFTDDEAEYMTQSATHHWLSIEYWTGELRSDENSYRRPTLYAPTRLHWPLTVS